MTSLHNSADPAAADESRVSVSRRTALKGGLCGAAGVLLGGRPTLASAAPKPAARASAVIQIWMWGGPCHLDTFDPKPQAGYDYCGALAKPIRTNTGSMIGELLPLLAKQADKYAIIRSMTHGNNGHETASYIVQTGRQPGGKQVFPSVGAVVSLFKGYAAGYQGLIPPYIVLTEPQGRFSEAGFLGSRYKPFATGGDPNQKRFAVEGIVAEGISDLRQARRRDLLRELDTLGRAMPSDQQLEAFGLCQEQAYELILGDAGKVFDLSQEKAELRDRYGRNTFGQSCLAARRLVERGVRYVTINFKGWDTHKRHFPAMRRLLPQLDKGLSTLFTDLADHGLLDTTIVWCGGEFGRTPRVQWEPPWNGGRNHFGAVFSSLVAGGGFRGGHVVGASDERGEAVRDRPVYPSDLVASMYQLLDIDPQATLPHPQGLKVSVAPTADEGIKSGGLLTEIM